MRAHAYPAGPDTIPGQRRRRLLGQATELIVLFVAYVLSARLGLMVSPVSGFATLVWPPTGIALAALLTHASSREIYREVEAGLLHFIESEGSVLICFNSLVNALNLKPPVRRP